MLNQPFYTISSSPQTTKTKLQIRLQIFQVRPRS